MIGRLSGLSIYVHNIERRRRESGGRRTYMPSDEAASKEINTQIHKYTNIQANLGIILKSFSEGKHLHWLSILLPMVMISHNGKEFS